jgi:hypothetical protein
VARAVAKVTEATPTCSGGGGDKKTAAAAASVVTPDGSDGDGGGYGGYDVVVPSYRRVVMPRHRCAIVPCCRCAVVVPSCRDNVVLSCCHAAVPSCHIVPSSCACVVCFPEGCTVGRRRTGGVTRPFLVNPIRPTRSTAIPKRPFGTTCTAAAGRGGDGDIVAPRVGDNVSGGLQLRWLYRRWRRRQ